MTLQSHLDKLNQMIINCRLCPRLVEYRENVKPRASFRGERYWRKPVPGFGDAKAKLLIVGLAPAAHGGNRTGRVFTGDESGRFLINALYECGLASQPISISRDDGLQLKGCYITAAVKCVPPANKPTYKEILNCGRYLYREIDLLDDVRTVLALGKIAFDAYVIQLKKKGLINQSLKFYHGAKYKIQGGPTLYASYHPTPRNTHTGTLTKGMFLSLLHEIRKEIGL